jgi:sporulation protein YlmC with PRC-barrel domain
MEIPVQTQVECKDGVCGHSLGVVIDPIEDKITHVVIQEEDAPHNEYMVPIKLASRSVTGTLMVAIDKAQLETMTLFKRTRYIQEKMPDGFSHYGIENNVGTMYYWPHVIPENKVEVPIDEYNVPVGEIMLERGTRVKATDGYVGKVDELVVNDRSKKITHLVMREGHLWGHKEVVIPISSIEKVNEETVHLKLSKNQIGRLPTFPLKRRW